VQIELLKFLNFILTYERKDTIQRQFNSIENCQLTGECPKARRWKLQISVGRFDSCHQCMKNVIILDLDGVLITTPPWRRDEIESDGYSKFNSSAIEKFNMLTDGLDFECELWLISDRRKGKTLEQLNLIFQNRKINKQLNGLVPVYGHMSRKEELEKFINENEFDNFLLIDDDSSLESLNDKCFWVKTKSLIGFGDEELNESKFKTLKWKQKNI